VRHRFPYLVVGLVATAACTDSPISPVAGALQVVVTTFGVDVDQDGYEISITRRPTVGVPVNDTLTLALPDGDYTVSLAGVASNCSLAGSVERQLTIAVGGSALASFQVYCRSLTGSIRVEAHSTGDAIDQDGYQVSISSPGPGNTMTLPANGFLDIPGLIGGTYTVTISGLASSCVVAGGGSRQVTVQTGRLARDTTFATFQVTCLGAVAEISAPTSGSDLDSAFTLTVDGGLPTPLSLTDSLEVPLEPGDHTLLLGDLASNCVVQGANPVTVTAAQGSRTIITFPVQCAPNMATARVSASMTGGTLDTQVSVGVDLVCDDWFYDCDFVFQGPLPIGGSTVVDVRAGTHAVWLLDLAPNCSAAGANPRSVNFPPGDTVDVAFDVNCMAAGTVRVHVSTTGSIPDDSYVLFLDEGDTWLPMSSFGSAVFDLVTAGQHTLLLGGVAISCRVSGSNPKSVTVTEGAFTDVVFQVDCDPDASLVITAPTSGADLPNFYHATIDQSTVVVVPTPGSVTVPVYSGAHSVELGSVASNCQVNGLNPAQVTVPAAGSATVSFPVDCTRYTGTARFTVTGTGPNQPSTLFLDYACYYYYGCSRLQVPVNGLATVDLPPAIFQFSVANLPANCTVAPATSIQLTITTGVTTDAAFTLTCH
jgi:hypothetical protein